MAKTCSIEGCNKPVWGKGKCSYHQDKKPLNQGSNGLKSTSRLKRKKKSTEQIIQENEQRDKMLSLFSTIWKKRGPYSEISGVFLGGECKTIFIHHILPKSKYPQLCLEEENLIIISFEEHQEVENDMYKYDEINQRREKIKEKFGIL